MAKTGMYVGLDIGTTSVKVVVAEYIEGQMNIIGVGNAKSDGLNRGIVVDIDQTVQAIQRAVRQAEEKRRPSNHEADPAPGISHW